MENSSPASTDTPIPNQPINDAISVRNRSRRKSLIIGGTIIVLLLVSTGAGAYYLNISKAEKAQTNDGRSTSPKPFSDNELKFTESFLTAKENSKIISGTKGKIVYSVGNNVYQYSASGEARLLIKTDKKKVLRSQSFSPEGNYFYYYEEVPGDYQTGYTISGIYLYNLTNNQITNLSNFKSITKWSKDGKKILGEDTNGLPMIYDVVNKSSTTVTQLWDKNEYVRWDQWDFNADGTKIAYISEGGVLHVYSLDNNQSEGKRELINYSHPIYWSPSSDLILIHKLQSSMNYNDMTLVAVNPITLELENIGIINQTGSGAPTPRSWSKDGRYFLSDVINQVYDVVSKKQIIISEEQMGKFYLLTSPVDMKWGANGTLITTTATPIDGIISEESKQNLNIINFPENSITNISLPQVTGDIEVVAVSNTDTKALIQNTKALYVIDYATAEFSLLIGGADEVIWSN